MVIGIIKRILGGREATTPAWDAEAALDPTFGVGLPVEGDSVDYDSIMANLEYKRMEIEQVRDVVVNEIRENYNGIVDALKKGDRETAELLAAEVALKKNIVKALSLVAKLLKLAVARIRTAKTAEEAVKALGPVVAVLRGLNPYLTNVSPELAAQISAIRDEIERLYSVPGIEVKGVDARSVVELVPGAESVLREAAKEVEKELGDIIPEPPEAPREHAPQRARRSAEGGGSSGVLEGPAPPKSYVSAIEEIAIALIDYIKRNGGRLNIRKASVELGFEPARIREALHYLQAKGVIRVSPAPARGPGGAEDVIV